MAIQQFLLNVNGETRVHYFLFSKTGFTKGCMEKAEKMGNVTLVRYADIVINHLQNPRYVLE